MTARPVYLPAGRWRDHWTGTVHSGPRWLTAPAPVTRIPLYVRDGSALTLPTADALGLPPGF